jgi:hypothetical protein
MAEIEKIKTPKSPTQSENQTWGGAREGAGRPKSSIFVSHNKRPRLDNLNKPVMVTLRLRSEMPSLISDSLYSTFHRACLRARGTGLRIIHFAVEAKKIKLLCEFKNQIELEKAMKSLTTTLAIAIKKQLLLDFPNKPKHKGPVFLGRFMMEILENHRELKLALRELFVPMLSDKDSEKQNQLRYTSGLLFLKWTELFNDENSETKQYVKSLSQFVNLESQMPFKRMATEITSTPLFSLTRKFEAP